MGFVVFGRGMLRFGLLSFGSSVGVVRGMLSYGLLIFGSSVGVGFSWVS